MSQTPTLQRALYFAEGTFLMTANDSVYFLPHGHAKAYVCYGEKKELFGKVSRTMKSTDPAVKNYSLTYEFEGDELIAARLVTAAGRSKGTMLPKNALASLQRLLNDGSLALQGIVNPPHLCSASRLPDGRNLLHVRELPGKDYNTLLLGTPGAYETLEIATGVQGGNSFYFTLKDGTRVALPSDFSGNVPRGEQAMFGDQPLVYLPRGRMGDLAAYGVDVAASAPHLDPYSPELKAPAPRAPAPKGP
jgi:hypothetical protein